jgi:hypothetical protein
MRAVPGGALAAVRQAGKCMQAGRQAGRHACRGSSDAFRCGVGACAEGGVKGSRTGKRILV